MRILLVHNYYGSEAPSGENRVYELERAMLESRGHAVLTYERRSDEIRGNGIFGMVRGALATPWNPATVNGVSAIARRFNPQIVHVHNTFPLISPSVFSSFEPDTARVMTLHNYRLVCPAGIPMRGGRICTECIDRRSVVPAMKYGCYRGSRAATFPLFASFAIHRWRGTWHREVDALVALSEFQRELMVHAGLPSESLMVRPNFCPRPLNRVPWEDRENRVIFVGRLSREKGLEDLIAAWAHWGRGAPELLIVGDGPLREVLERSAASAALNVRFLGAVGSIKARRLIGESRLVVLPSVCYETFGMTICEGFAAGTPALVSDLGSLPAMMAKGKAGCTFRAGDSQDLFRRARELWDRPDSLEKMGRGAAEEFERSYTEDAAHRSLMSIYEEAVVRRRKRTGP